MKVLVLNCGSSSIKYKLFNMDDQSVMAQGGIEKIGNQDSFLKLKTADGTKATLEKYIPEHTAGVQFVFDVLTSAEYGAIKSLDEIDAVGHRMVHGGERFSESVLLNQEVLAAFEACNDLAPLHNPANLKGIAAVSALLPNVPQVGVFDTAFHQTMPDYAYMYAIPYEMYEKYGIRRYGFHGTSHRFVAQRVCEYLGVDPKGKRIITCHIGNGASIAAVKDGKCIDTSMGLTPLEGLMMGTRSGDIDGGAVTFLMNKLGMNADEQGNISHGGQCGTWGEANVKTKRARLFMVNFGGKSAAYSDFRENWQAVTALSSKWYWYPSYYLGKDQTKEQRQALIRELWDHPSAAETKRTPSAW